MTPKLDITKIVINLLVKALFTNEHTVFAAGANFAFILKEIPKQHIIANVESLKPY